MAEANDEIIVDSSEDDLWDFAADLDESVLREVAQLEAQASRNPSLLAPAPNTSNNKTTSSGPGSRVPHTSVTRNLGNASSTLQRSNSLVTQNHQARLASASTSTSASNSSTRNNVVDLTNMRLQQKDLFGNIVNPVPGPSSRASSFSTSAQIRVNAVSRKKWDQTVYAKSAARQRAKKKAASAKKKGAKGKGKGKARASDDDDDDDDDDEEGDDFDDELDFDDDDIDGLTMRADGVPLKPPSTMKLQPDLEACKTFVYPLNKAMRDYQYSIVQRAFYTDTLVALPTGLGKTFLAAVVMLNFYRWFPKGKIIFMAPSRPLVTQQIQACHGIVGIPLQDAVELTGKDPPDKREDEWRRRRVFYCTPQTVKNDLHKGRLDPSDVVCIVVDEAHKATGDYAYTEVVRHLMRFNPFFRVLALTATPGGNAEVVQSVIDNLHIGHIEVRTDESLDIRPYIHKKKIDQIRIPVEGELGSIRDRYIVLMNILLEPLKKAKVYMTSKTDPTTIGAYSFQVASQRLNRTGQKWAFTPLSFLGAMSRCITKLLEQSVLAFNESLKELQKSAKGKNKLVIEHPNFRSILKDTQDIVDGRGFAGHPKMVKLRELVQEHFEECKKDGTFAATRVMVFCTYREVVEEIVQRLNQSDGINATRLVGQGIDAKGKKGLGQKQQNEVLREFKDGKYNVLVATSIGEEGLDIGELDLIVCYEAPKSSIRTLQRAGRTGRARDGRVIVLMTEGTEETNWNQAHDDYKGVQNAIISGKQFELYMDNHRLVPADIKPIVEKKIIEIEPFDPDKMGIGQRRTSSTGKRKRDEKDNLDLFESGFQKASGRKSPPRKSRASKAAAIKEEEFEEAQVVGDGKLTDEEKVEMKRYTIKPSVQAAQPALTRKTPLPSRLPIKAKHQYSTLAGPKPMTYSVSKEPYMAAGPTRTETIAKILRAGHVMSTPGKYKTWEEETYQRFNISKVEFWPDEKAQTGRDTRFRSFAPPVENRESRNLSSSGAAGSTTKVGHKSPSRETTGSDDEAAKSDLSNDDEDDYVRSAFLDHELWSDDDLPELPASKGKEKTSACQVKSTESGAAVFGKASTSHHHNADEGEAPIFIPAAIGIGPEAGAELAPQPAPNGRTSKSPLQIDSGDEEDDDEVQEVIRPASRTVSSGAEMTPPLQIRDGPRREPCVEQVPHGDVTMAEEESVQPAKEPNVKVNAADQIILETSPSTGECFQSGQDAAQAEFAVPRLPQTLKSTSKTPAKADTSVEESPVVIRRRGAVKRVLVKDDTSSPDKSADILQPVRNVRESPRIPVATAPRWPGRLIRAAQVNIEDDSVEIVQEDGKHKKRTKEKQKKLPGDACPFFDLRAINSDDPDSETDPEEGASPETTRDRVFLDSDDVANPNDMSAFYRQSLMSQANHRFGNEVIRPGAFRMRVDAGKRYVAPRRDEEETSMDASQWSMGSFVCADDEIEYEDQDDGLPDDEDTQTSDL